MKTVPSSILFTACVASFVVATIINRMALFVSKENNEGQQQLRKNGGGTNMQEKIFEELDSINASVQKISDQLLMIKEGEQKGQGSAGGDKSEVNQLQQAGHNNNNNCEEKLVNLDHTWDLRRQARKESITKWARGGTRNSIQLFDIFEPEAVCLDDERFGASAAAANAASGESFRYKAFGDGPKFVCGVDRIAEKAKENNNPGKGCLIYSVGSNNQIDFEVSVTKAFGKGNCELHTFDPTVPPKTFIGNEYTTFHDWGFGQDGVEATVNHKTRGRFEFTQMSVQTAMKKLGHEDRTIDIFKIDCEGCEYTALTAAFNAIADGLIKIDQVQVEVHRFGEFQSVFPDVKKLFEAADRANMRVFHKERNGWGCQGNKCVEYAFASNDFLRRANAHYMCR